MLAVWLALLLVLSGRVPAVASTQSDLEAATVFCHAGQDAGHGKPVLPQRVHEAAVLLHAGMGGLNQPAITPCAPSPAAPHAWQAAPQGRPQARAPPPHSPVFALARGPPLPV